MMIHDCYLRWNWEISRRDLHSHQFIAMFNANREFLDLDFSYSSAPSTRSLIFFRIIAIIVISFPPFINVFCMKKMKKKKVVCEKLFCGVESLNQSTRSNNLKNVVHISRGYWLIHHEPRSCNNFLW